MKQIEQQKWYYNLLLGILTLGNFSLSYLLHIKFKTLLNFANSLIWQLPWLACLILLLLGLLYLNHLCKIVGQVSVFAYPFSLVVSSFPIASFLLINSSRDLIYYFLAKYWSFLLSRVVISSIYFGVMLFVFAFTVLSSLSSFLTVILTPLWPTDFLLGGDYNE